MLIRGKEVVKVAEADRISAEEALQAKNDNHHVYRMRHDDEGDWSIPVTIEQRVLVNYWGYLITKEPFDNPGPDSLYIELTEEEGYNLAEWRLDPTA
jgi:hypothetical protein